MGLFCFDAPEERKKASRGSHNCAQHNEGDGHCLLVLMLTHVKFAPAWYKFVNRKAMSHCASSQGAWKDAMSESSRSDDLIAKGRVPRNTLIG